jgi:hypothetical protein
MNLALRFGSLTRLEGHVRDQKPGDGMLTSQRLGENTSSYRFTPAGGFATTIFARTHPPSLNLLLYSNDSNALFWQWYSFFSESSKLVIGDTAIILQDRIRHLDSPLATLEHVVAELSDELLQVIAPGSCISHTGKGPPEFQCVSEGANTCLATMSEMLANVFIEDFW